MTNFLRGAIIGAVALGGLAVASTETYAMPVVAGGMPPAVESGDHADISKVYWRRWGWGWGWRRPYYGYGWGWRRPFYGYGYGWRRPYWGGYRRYW